MSAQVIAYSADPQDEHLTLKAECRACEIEWGWSKDTANANDWLEQSVAEHNTAHHTRTS